MPGPQVAGGLGATCTDNGDCITSACASTSDAQFCTAACDEGGVCPLGFTCLDTSGGSGVCWPSDDGGGCAASGDGEPVAIVLFALPLLALVVRRRA